MKPIRFIDMFCGIGGFRLGLERCNEQNGEGRRYVCVWANDIDKHSCRIYRRHFGYKEIEWGDITSIEPDTIPDHDLLCAGFPCQSFSIAGKRRGFEDTRGTLFFDICRVLRVKRTPYVLLENVKNLLSHDGGSTFQTILESLDELGYDCQWELLDSQNFGVPQHRERVFIIGNLRGQPRPEIFPLGESDKSFNESQGKARSGRTRFRVANTLSERDYRDGARNLIAEDIAEVNTIEE